MQKKAFWQVSLEGQHYNMESGIRNAETEYGIRERRFQAIDYKKKIEAMTIKLNE